ncbi:thiamine phosphate synthase [Halosegnis rubeus]|uniref:thiamine phosphate synthase n=1 Tax=Halosegnis rubeus TaxID=2212850 RepID=UPI003743ED07
MQTYLVTEARFSTHSTLETVEAAIAGGVDVVQLREKATSVRERYDLGRQLREVTRAADVPLIVNDRVDLAAAIDADGVHLGDDDLPIGVAREQLGGDAIIGRSVSTAEAAEEAAAGGADYLGVGAVFATGSKETDPEESEIGLDTVRKIDAAVDIPFVGIGGIDATNARDVIEAGADGVAVISAITDTDDPEAATRALHATVAGTEVES